MPGPIGVTRREALLFLTALGMAPEWAAAEEKDSASNGLIVKVRLENDRVRVLEYASTAGSPNCGVGRHYHPTHLTIMITPARIRARRDDGTVAESERNAGDVFWFESGWHATENVGPGPARICMVELKDKDWKPSTGTNL